MSWVLSLIKIELKKASEYRANFFVELFGYVLSQFAIAYFVWLSVFSESGQSEISGYSFQMMVFYALVVPIIARASYGVDYSEISEEVYSGALNKYLIYPVSFGLFKLFQQLSKNSIVMFQLVFAIILYQALWGLPVDVDLGVGEWLFFVLLLFMSMWLSFLVALCIQLVSFWADHVWSLMLCFRFFVHFAGGAWIPLALFPDKYVPLLRSLPSYLVIGYPMEFMLGKLSFAHTLYYFLLSILWSVILYAFARFIWHRGMKVYSGVGI